MNAVVAVDGALVAVGDKRNGVDTGGASFEAAAWRSEDGATWTEVALPGVVPAPGLPTTSPYAAHVVVVGDRLLAGGGLAGAAALWSSDDARRDLGHGSSRPRWTSSTRSPGWSRTADRPGQRRRSRDRGPAGPVLRSPTTAG